MAAATRAREPLEQPIATMDALLETSDRALAMPSSHACAQGKNVWTLMTNAIDHIHTGQVLEARHEEALDWGLPERACGGGHTRGGTRLTAEGRRFLRRYRAFRDQAHAAVSWLAATALIETP